MLIYLKERDIKMETSVWENASPDAIISALNSAKCNLKIKREEIFNTRYDYVWIKWNERL